MNNKNINKIVNNLLNEEIEKKASLMVEKLTGKQHKIDVAEPKGKITGADFAMLRSMKKKETKEGSEMCEQCGGPLTEGECMECMGESKSENNENWGAVARIAAPMVASYIGSKFAENNEEVEEGNLFTDKLRKTKKGEKFKIGNKTYTDKSDLDESSLQEKWKGDVKVKKTGEHSDKTVAELKKELNSLKEKSKKIQDQGKKVPKSIIDQESEIKFAIRAKQGWKKGEGAMKESKSVTFTESEIVDIIEKLVIEAKDNIQKKKVAANTKLEKSNKTTKKEEGDYMSDLVEKMKNYLKDGSKGKYEMNPTQFPKGNGELGEMEKKAYKASKPVEEYIENFTAAGLENLVYDEIHPNEEWMTANIEGSSKTGNSPKYANAVETNVNKRRNEIRKQNLLGAAKQLAYNKAPQPTEDVVGPQAKFQKNFGKDAATKVNKILNQLESVDEKETKKINEEMNRMRNIIGYRSNTQ